MTEHWRISMVISCFSNASLLSSSELDAMKFRKRRKNFPEKYVSEESLKNLIHGETGPRVENHGFFFGETSPKWHKTHNCVVSCVYVVLYLKFIMLSKFIRYVGVLAAEY